MINITIAGYREKLLCDLIMFPERDKHSGRQTGLPLVGYFDLTVQEARQMAFMLLAKAEELDDERYERKI